MFRFANPYYFFLLIPVGIGAWFIYRKRIRSGVLFAPTFRIVVGKQTWRTYATYILPLLFLGGLVLSILALARPQKVFSRIRRAVDVIAIEMVVDVSGSMRALDLSIKTPAGVKEYRTRLDVVKETFTDFVKKRPEDLIGLVTFGGYATTRSPLTTDSGALLHILQGVEIPKPDIRNGQIVNRDELMTAIGDALATACARLEHAEPKSKVIVLLSDGKSNTGIIRPETAIKAAEKLGIKVYTIGVGTTGRAPFWGTDMLGGKHLQYNEVILDEELLKKIAKTTGGQYFNVKDPEGLEKAMKEIDKLEKTKIEKEEYHQYNELFPWFLGLAAGLVIMGTGLNMMIGKRIM